MGYIDLHVHTTASDGLLNPKEVIQWASKKHLEAIAITDHDTIDGIEEAIYYGKKNGIKVIPGIEINTDYKGLEIHILGYLIDYKEKWFQDLLKELRLARYNRAKKMVQKLQDLGLSITMKEVEANANAASIGRPHIARVLINNGWVKTMKEAFDEYIGKEGPAFVERYKITPCEAIKYISDCGGIPVLAHPGLIKDNSIIKELVNCGLQGLEVYHSKHDQNMVHLYNSIAKQYHLIITGGSDFHGSLHEGQPILGSLNIDKSIIEDLQNKKNSME